MTDETLGAHGDRSAEPKDATDMRGYARIRSENPRYIRVDPLAKRCGSVYQGSELYPSELASVALSLQVTAVATLVIFVVGLALALMLARRRFPGKTFGETLVNLPWCCRRPWWAIIC